MSGLSDHQAIVALIDLLTDLRIIDREALHARAADPTHPLAMAGPPRLGRAEDDRALADDLDAVRTQAEQAETVAELRDVLVALVEVLAPADGGTRVPGRGGS